jgi:hypothetical protein
MPAKSRWDLIQGLKSLSERHFKFAPGICAVMTFLVSFLSIIKTKIRLTVNVAYYIILSI